MLKYHSNYIGFREIPDEITLCINISNCPNNCIGCHSPHLKEDVGESLNPISLENMITSNTGITCVCFMGGDNSPATVNWLAYLVKHTYNLKSAWYSGKPEISRSIDVSFFDYIKIGPYIEEKGPLDNPDTNQILYQIEWLNDRDSTIGQSKFNLKNITYKFWK